MERLSDKRFVDLYIGATWCDVTGFDGRDGREALPPPYLDDANALRQLCDDRFKRLAENEFSLKSEGIIFRVTALEDINNSFVYVLRRSYASIRPIAALGLKAEIISALLSKEARGLVLIAGEMGAGKTSTAASLMAEYLKINGGVGIALEDPIETPLQGVWGKGRCLQIAVSRKVNGYADAMPLALRSGARIMFIGEIRNEQTAIEVVRAGINGHLVISTIHAGNIVQAVERMHTFASSMPNASSLLADGLSYVIHQSLKAVVVASPNSDINASIAPRLVAQTLQIKDKISAKALIREGRISALDNEISQQTTRMNWSITK